MRLGVGLGDRVATIAWNNHRHFEAYYAISGIGAVCHTINPRLFADQLAYIVNHAEDKVLLVDLTFVPLAEKMAASWPATPALCRDDRPGAHAGDEPPQRALLRGHRRRRDPRARVAGVRREHRRSALLHLGYDRQSQGRPLQPSFDAPAYLRALRLEQCRNRYARCALSDRADVPCQCLGHPLRRGDGRREARLPRLQARWCQPAGALRGRRRDLRPWRADGLARPAAAPRDDRQAH